MTTRSKSALFPAASPDTQIIPLTRGDRIATVVLVLAYAGMQIALTVAHSAWRDEAQAWLWATSIDGWREFLFVPGEGHPPLWYWLLRGLSYVTDFAHARYLTAGVAIINAVLLASLIRGQIALLAMMLLSHVVLIYWGYNFRPYSLIFCAVLVALLLERSGRSVAASWIMALACGFHFFTGFLFGFWLLVRWHRGTPIRHLQGPAALGLVFGACALISGIGNPEGVPSDVGLLDSVAFNLAWPLPWPALRIWPVALGTLALIVYGLWHHRFIMLCLVGLIIAFAVGCAIMYGQLPWHSAFMLMLTFMGFVLAGPHKRSWVLLVLLAPQAVAGIANGQVRLGTPVWSQPDVYAAIQADAGPEFEPTRQLIAWQDYNLTVTAATHGIGYISGNNGQVLGPVDWRQRIDWVVDPEVTETATPYWLVCALCDDPLAAIDAAGLQATELARGINPDDGLIFAYRVER